MSSLWVLTLSILLLWIPQLKRVPICSHFETYLRSLNTQIKMAWFAVVFFGRITDSRSIRNNLRIANHESLNGILYLSLTVSFFFQYRQFLHHSQLFLTKLQVSIVCIALMFLTNSAYSQQHHFQHSAFTFNIQHIVHNITFYYITQLTEINRESF